MRRQPSESLEGRALVRWVELEHGKELKIAHVPNELMFTLLGEQAGRLHAEGVRRGFPDYVVVHVRSHRVVFVELKRRSGGVVSVEQKTWIAAFGKRAAVCHGWHEAAEFIKEKLL